MDALIDIAIRKTVEFLFVHPKSTTTLIVLLVIVLLIALYVNRHRDARGRVSFLDRGRSGVLGARIHRLEEGERKEVWLLPLWAGERNLLIEAKIVLPKGDYGISAYWAPDGELTESEIFVPRTAGKENAHSLSRTAAFSLDRNTAVGFRLTAADGKLHIDSPDAAQLAAGDDAPPLPLPIGDPSLEKLARWLQRGKRLHLWRLTLQDDRIMEGVQNAAKSVRRKLDGMTAEKKRLEGQLDQAVQRIKEAQPKKAKAKT